MKVCLQRLFPVLLSGVLDFCIQISRGSDLIHLVFLQLQVVLQLPVTTAVLKHLLIYPRYHAAHLILI